MKKTVLITGASQGIGKAAALHFQERGYTVIAVSRSATQSAALKAAGIAAYDMDLADEQSMHQTLQQVLADYPRIDVLVNNAGFCQNGFLEELSLSQLRTQFEVNVFGLIYLTQQLLPSMRSAKKGRIINVGSVGGEFTSPGASAYHASKYALESFTDAMRQELQQFGIQVVLIKPGGVATAFTENAKAGYPKPIAGNPYRHSRQRFHEMLDNILDPEKSNTPLLTAAKVAKTIVAAAEDGRPASRYRIGVLAHVIPLLKRLLSDRAFDRMLLRQLKLT